MKEFLFSLLGIAVLGILIQILDISSQNSIQFVFDIIVLLVMVVNILRLLGSLGLY